MIGLLFPRFDHPAIEERYASWQSQMLLRRDGELDLCFYDPEEPASYAAGDLESDHVLVVTDPLLVPPPKLAIRLREVLVQNTSTAAALPSSNEADNAAQRRAAPAAYLTLRELQQMTSEMQQGSYETVTIKWDKSDPAAYLCRTSMLADIDDPPRRQIGSRVWLRRSPPRRGAQGAAALPRRRHRDRSARGGHRPQAHRRRLLRRRARDHRRHARAVRLDHRRRHRRAPRGAVVVPRRPPPHRRAGRQTAAVDPERGQRLGRQRPPARPLRLRLHGIDLRRTRAVLHQANHRGDADHRRLVGGRDRAAAGHRDTRQRRVAERARQHPPSLVERGPDAVRLLRHRPEPMKIAYLAEDTDLSGGIRVQLAHADALIARGHRVRMVTKGAPITWRRSDAEFVFVDDFRDYDARDDDFLVGTFWITIPRAHELAPDKAVHLCQGYEGSFTAYHPIRHEIEAAYRLPIPKLVVSATLIPICKQFTDDVTFIGQVVDDEFYRPSIPPENDPLRVLLVGQSQADLRGIEEGYGAAAHARWFHQKLELVRVSPWAPSREEPLDSVDEFHVALTTSEMTRLMHSCDVLLAPNHKEEGFGLPAAEALA